MYKENDYFPVEGLENKTIEYFKLTGVKQAVKSEEKVKHEEDSEHISEETSEKILKKKESIVSENISDSSDKSDEEEGETEEKNVQDDINAPGWKGGYQPVPSHVPVDEEYVRKIKRERRKIIKVALIVLLCLGLVIGGTYLFLHLTKPKQEEYPLFLR